MYVLAPNLTQHRLKPKIPELQVNTGRPQVPIVIPLPLPLILVSHSKYIVFQHMLAIVQASRRSNQ